MAEPPRLPWHGCKPLYYMADFTEGTNTVVLIGACKVCHANQELTLELSSELFEKFHESLLQGLRFKVENEE